MTVCVAAAYYFNRVETYLVLVLMPLGCGWWHFMVA